nr:hypothetical protein [Tanacetum cinerariifolium]
MARSSTKELLTPFEYPEQVLRSRRKSSCFTKGSMFQLDKFWTQKKWHNETSSNTRSTKTSDGLAAIQSQLNNLGREIKKVNEKVYAAQTPESPINVASPTSLLESTSSILVPILCRTAGVVMRVPPAMSLGLSSSMAEVAAMSKSVFCKRLENDEEDEEIEESLDSNSVSENAEDEGPTLEDEDPAAGDEGLATRDEGPGENEKVVPEGQQKVVLIVRTAMSTPLGLGYGVLRCRELALEEDHVYSTFEVGQGSGSTPEFERLDRVSAIRQAILTAWTDLEDATSTTAETERFLTELGAQVEMQEGLIRDHTVRLEEPSTALFERSLEHEQERVAVTFRALRRPVLALKSWAGQTDAQRATMWHAINDTQEEDWKLRTY